MSFLKKPSKTQRRKEEKQIKTLAKDYRIEQKTKAIYRDKGLCTACYFLDHRRCPAVDVHHVYGRAITKNVPTDWREHFSSLLCLCREHHNQVGIINKKGFGAHPWVEEVLEVVNSSPINEDFIQ